MSHAQIQWIITGFIGSLLAVLLFIFAFFNFSSDRTDQNLQSLVRTEVLAKRDDSLTRLDADVMYIDKTSFEDSVKSSVKTITTDPTATVSFKYHRPEISYSSWREEYYDNNSDYPIDAVRVILQTKSGGKYYATYYLQTTAAKSLDRAE